MLFIFDLCFLLNANKSSYIKGGSRRAEAGQDQEQGQEGQKQGRSRAGGGTGQK